MDEASVLTPARREVLELIAELFGVPLEGGSEDPEASTAAPGSSQS